MIQSRLGGLLLGGGRLEEADARFVSESIGGNFKDLRLVVDV